MMTAHPLSALQSHHQVKRRTVEPVHVFGDEYGGLLTEATRHVVACGVQDVLVEPAGIGGFGDVTGRRLEAEDGGQQRHHGLGGQASAGKIGVEKPQALGPSGVALDPDRPLQQPPNRMESRILVEGGPDQLDDRPPRRRRPAWRSGMPGRTFPRRLRPATGGGQPPRVHRCGRPSTPSGGGPTPPSGPPVAIGPAAPDGRSVRRSLGGPEPGGRDP